MRPMPATIERDLRERVNALLQDTLKFRDEQSFEVKSIFKDADKLSHASGVASSLIKAETYALCGNEGQVRYWIANAKKLGGHHPADISGVVIFANLGRFSEAAALYEGLAEDPDAVRQIGTLGTVVAAFQAMTKAADLMARAKLEVDMEPALTSAKAAHAALHRLGVSEASLRAMLDVAGEVLRRHSILWAEEQPLIRVVDDEEDAAVLYQLYVPVSADQAFTLTDEVFDVLVERNIFHPGVSFSFLGARP